MSIKKSTGGAATNRGIWYQALWCVLCAASVRIRRTDVSKGQGGYGVHIVLEPLGGDAWVERAEGRRVVQLKTLSSGTWSIKNVVADVLPDLYRAVPEDSPTDTTYEFVTEGRFGDWSEVLDFFNALHSGIGPDTSASEFNAAYVSLDNKTQLAFGGSDGEFWKRGCTRRALFDRIVECLRTKTPAKKENIDDTRRKTWHMLARFCFNGGITEKALHQDLCEALLPVVHHREDIPNVLEAMVGRIIKRSSGNETTITPADLFEVHDLKHVLSISRWGATKEMCRTQSQRRAELRDYRPKWDVRLPHVSRPSDSTSAPFVVVCGESGLGKSWWLYAQTHLRDELAPVILTSTGHAEDDLQSASNRVWQDALGHDEALPLKNLAQRRADVLNRSKSEIWLRVCLDQLTCPVAARDLLATPVEDWGVRVVVACDEAVLPVFEDHQREQPHRVQIVRLDRFGAAERDNYLELRLGDAWGNVPADISELIRKPQLADLYCQLFEGNESWQPQNEYELIEKYWQRLAPRDALHLANLAATLCSDASYPWYEDQLANAEINAEAPGRMTSGGWLRQCTDARYEVPHDRLLNFAVAKGLAVAHRSGSMSDEHIADLLGRMLEGDPSFKSLMAGYVPMDWLFIRLREDRPAAERVIELVEEKLQHHTRKVFHRELLPTLGVVAVRPLVRRLVALAAAGDWFDTNSVIAGLSAFSTGDLHDHIEEILADDRPRVRKAALRILGQRPLPEFLDQVWQLHVEMQSTPSLFFGDDAPADGKSAVWLYDDSFKALRSCVQLDPGWIVSAVRKADSETEPVQTLGYLIANLNDGGTTWRACKADLFEKVSSEKRRCLAMNIGIWRDRSELHRLKAWVDIETDDLGPAALRALAQIDPKLGAAGISALPEFTQYVCRNWYLPRLVLTAPEEMRVELHGLVQQSKAPLKTARIFQGYENEIDGPTLEILLDALDEAISTLVGEIKPNPGDRASKRYADTDSLYMPLTILAAVGRRDLLSVFRSRKGSSLESKLERLLAGVIGPRCNLWQDSLTRAPALEVLLKIGGDGYGRVVSIFLDAETAFGKFDAIDAAVKCSSQEITTKLRKIAISDELWNETHHLQTQAMRALAVLGDGTGVLTSAIRLGLKVPRDIPHWLHVNVLPTAEAIQKAHRMIQERDAKLLPGALIGIGLFRVAEAVDDVIAVLRDAPDPDARVAAIIALGRIGEPANAAVERIRDRITDTHDRHAAVVALWRIGSPEAHRCLLESLTDSWDASVAVRLTRISALRTQSLSLLTERLRLNEESVPLVMRSDLDVLLEEASDELLVEILPRLPASNDRVRETAFAHEGSFWIVGSKASAIRGLAATDFDAAFLAARKCLTNVDAHDRHMYPPLLSKANAVAAREFYLELAATEKNKAVLWSMAHALRSTDMPWLITQLSATSADVRLAACRLVTGNASDDDTVQQKLLERLADFDERVASASEESLFLLRRQERASEVAEEFKRKGHDVDLKHWAALEAVVQVGHCGYEGTQWPEWATKLGDSDAFKAWPALRLTLQERMVEKRKKALQEEVGRARTSH